MLMHIADGLTNRQIGQEMFLAEKTVKNYVSSILAKLGMERRTQAAVFASKLRERSRRRQPSGGGVHGVLARGALGAMPRPVQHVSAASRHLDAGLSRWCCDP